MVIMRCPSDWRIKIWYSQTTRNCCQKINEFKEMALRGYKIKKRLLWFHGRDVGNGPCRTCIKGWTSRTGMVYSSPWVYHLRKPNKIRMVFACSLHVNENSSNKNLLQGPDQTNFTGVFCRFRQEPIPIDCDIEGMFQQVRVNKRHRDLLRFLWWTSYWVSNDSTLLWCNIIYRVC